MDASETTRHGWKRSIAFLALLTSECGPICNTVSPTLNLVIQTSFTVGDKPCSVHNWSPISAAAALLPQGVLPFQIQEYKMIQSLTRILEYGTPPDLTAIRVLHIV